jgi:hypothetical protein
MSQRQGRVYYLNLASGESTWVLPAGALVVPPLQAAAAAPAAPLFTVPATAPIPAPVPALAPTPPAPAPATDTLIDDSGTLWQQRFTEALGVHYVNAAGALSLAMPPGARRAPPELQFSALPHNALSTAPQQPAGGGFAKAPQQPAGGGFAKAWSLTRKREYYVDLASGACVWELPKGARVADRPHGDARSAPLLPGASARAPVSARK